MDIKKLQQQLEAAYADLERAIADRGVAEEDLQICKMDCAGLRRTIEEVEQMRREAEARADRYQRERDEARVALANLRRNTSGEQ